MPEPEHVCPSFPCPYCHDVGTGFSSVPSSSSVQCPLPSKDQGCTSRPTFEIGESSTSGRWEGFSHRSKEGRWVAEIRPSRPEWAKGGPGRPAGTTGDLKIALGSYKTMKGAAMAYDVGIIYTEKPVKFNLWSPAGFVAPFPEDRLSFKNSEHVGAISRFVRDQAYAYVAKYEKAEAPPPSKALPSEEDSQLHADQNGHQMGSDHGIDSCPSMGSKLRTEADNNEELQGNHESFTSACPLSIAEMSSSEALWLKDFLDSLPDPSPDHLNFPELLE